MTNFNDRVSKADEMFTNRKRNKTFDAIKKCLNEMSPGFERCVYCEDSKGDEIEHIYPKNLYPEKCFDWENYVYACGTCNSPKNNKFAIFRHDNGEYQEVNLQPISQSPIGEIVFINPRVDNPLDFSLLDLDDTFIFKISAPPNTREFYRADYTYNNVLRLNEQRPYLLNQRKNAYENYKSRLHRYIDKKNQGAEQPKLDRIIHNLKNEHHPTVWKEMQRQFEWGWLAKFDSELDELFQQSPEALTW